MFCYFPEKKKCFVCIISKKTEKSAVKRNKMRRRVYSILLNENFDFKDYTYIQIFPKKTAFQKNYINLKDDIISLIKKI